MDKGYLHYQDGEDRTKPTLKEGVSASVEKMIELEEGKQSAVPVWEQYVQDLENELNKVKDFDYWYDNYYSVKKLNDNEDNTTLDS